MPIRTRIRRAALHRPTAESAVRFARFKLGRIHDVEFAVAAAQLETPPGVILDIGAHQGQALLTLRKLFPHAAIVSVEPNPFVWAELSRSSRWAGNSTVLHFALSDTDGEDVLHVPNVDGFLGTQGSSLLKDFTAARSADFVQSYGRAPDDFASVVATTRKIDSLGLQPDLIKIDVEGAERMVLEGGLRTLNELHPPVLFETRGSDGAAEAYLRSLGYGFIDLARDAGGINSLAVWREAEDR